MEVPESVAVREERSAGRGDPRSWSEGGAESARAETKRQRARERQSGLSRDAGPRAGGPTEGRKHGRAGGRTDGQTGRTGQGRAGRRRRPSPRGAAAAPGGAGRAPGVRAEEAAAATTTWVGQTDGVTDGLAAAAASGGHSPSSLTRPGPRLRFCTPERRGLRVKAPRRPRPSRQPAARASPGIPGPSGGARAHAHRAAHALAGRS